MSEEVVTLSAEFADLHDVARVLAQHIRSGTGIADVQVGPPQEVASTEAPGVRITLLYTTPAPAPRTEPVPVGSAMLPPLRLACFYLVSTSGAVRGDPMAAHNALGQVLRLYHDSPVLQLPLSAPGESRSSPLLQLGQGQVRVTPVPSTLEQIAQIWLALRQRLQPCTVIDVAPVDLVGSLPAASAPRPSR